VAEGIVLVIALLVDCKYEVLSVVLVLGVLNDCMKSKG
jgi:hypothetical protein